MQGLDSLLRFVAEEIALRGKQGASPHDVLHFIQKYYNGVRDATDRSPLEVVSLRRRRKCPDHPSVDAKFLESIWTWLIAHHGLRFREEASSAGAAESLQEKTDNVELTETNDARPEPQSPLAEPQASSLTDQVATTSEQTKEPDLDAIASSSGLRGCLFASDDRMWHAITGHGVDYRRVKPLEFDILQLIAASGSAGLSQPDIIRLTCQDKRSLPKRTDELAAHGYIEKKPILLAGMHTSWCTLKKFVATSAASSSLPPEDEIAAIFTNSGIMTEKFLDVAMRLIKEADNITLNDFRYALGIKTRRWEVRSVRRYLREMEALGCIRRVTAPEPRRDGRPIYRSLQFVKDVDERMRYEFLHLTRKKDKDQVQLEDDDDDDYSILENIESRDSITEDASLHQMDSVQRLHIPAYELNTPSLNLIYAKIDEAGSDGIVFTASCGESRHVPLLLTKRQELLTKTFGTFYRKPLEHTITRLTDYWQDSQPAHLQHLAIVRDTILIDKTPQYHYRSFPNFQAAVKEGLTSWEAVGINSHDPTLTRTRDDVDEYGFSRIDPRDLVGGNGNASVTSSRRAMKIDKKEIGRPRASKSKAVGMPSATRVQKRQKLDNRIAEDIPTTADVDLFTHQSLLAKVPNGRRAKQTMHDVQIDGHSVHNHDQSRTDDNEDETCAEDQVLHPDHRPKRKGEEHESSNRPMKSMRLAKSSRSSLSLHKAVSLDRLPSGVHINPENRRKAVKAKGRPKKTLLIVISLHRLRNTAEHISKPVNRDLRTAGDEVLGDHTAYKTPTKQNPIITSEDGLMEQASTQTELSFDRRRDSIDGEIATSTRQLSSVIHHPDVTRGPAATAASERVADVDLQDKVFSTPTTPRPNDRLESGRTITQPDIVMGNSSVDEAVLLERVDDVLPNTDAWDARKREDPADNIRFEINHKATESFPATTEVSLNPQLSPAPQASGRDKAARKSGVSLASGSIAHKRSQIIYDIIDRAGGAFPGNREIHYPFITETHKIDPTSNPEKETINRAVKNLVDSAKLRRITFALKDKDGVMHTSQLLTRPEIAPDSDVVRDLQKQMTEAFPRMYLPESIDIEPELRAIATRSAVRGRAFPRAVKTAEPSASGQSSAKSLPPKGKGDQAWRKWLENVENLKAASATDADRSVEGEAQVSIPAAIARLAQNHGREAIASSENQANVGRDSAALGGAIPAKRRRNFARLNRTIPRLAANEQGHAVETVTLPHDGSIQNGHSDGEPAPESSLRAHPAAKAPTLLPAGEPRRARPSLRIQPNIHREFEDRLPESLDDIIAQGVPSRKGRPRRNSQLKIDFEIQHIQKWEETNTEVLSSELQTGRARFINLSAPDVESLEFQPLDLDELQVYDGQKTRPTRRRSIDTPLEYGVGNATPITPAYRSRLSAADLMPPPGARGVIIGQKLPSDSSSEDTPEHSAMGASSPNIVDPPQLERPNKAKPKTARQRQRRGRGGKHSVAFAPSLSLEESPVPETPEYPADGSSTKPKSKRGPRNANLFTEAQIQRFIMTVVVVRTLTGGLDRLMNWVMVHSLFLPEAGMEREFLRKRWNSVYIARKAFIMRLQTDFQEAYIRAYEDGIIPSIDYDADINLYPWTTVIDWALENMHTPPGDTLPDLPATRADFDATFTIEPPADPHDAGIEELYLPATTKTKRDQIMHELDFSLPLRPAPKLDSDLSLAKAYVRANICTPEDTYDPPAARATLAPLGEALLERALAELLDNKHIKQEKRTRAGAGRTYALSDQLFACFKRSMPVDRFFQSAVRYKAELDSAFEADGAAAFSFHASDAEVLCLTNLLAARRVTVCVDMPPVTREITTPLPKGRITTAAARTLSWWGFTTTNYKTAQMDRENLLFPLRVVPAPAYVTGIPPLDLAQEPPPPPLLPDASLARPMPLAPDILARPFPLWADIQGKLLPELWSALLLFVLSTVALRPGAGGEEVARAMKGGVAGWEVEMLLRWGEEVGVVRRVGDGVGTGWCAGEWWWCVFGDGVGGGTL